MRIFLAFSALILLFLSSCDPDRAFLTGDDLPLRFEVDTLRFDTVFTQRGSATRFLKIYNEGVEPLKIDRVEVRGMTGVTFDINVDGYRGPVAEDVIIWGEDSIYVFVEVEVDPTAPEENSPFIIEDRLVVTTGQREREIVLEAFGQNANYVNGFGQGVPFLLSCGNGETNWTADLPYVIYGEMFIDSCTLNMLAGTRVYVHGGVARNEVFGIFNDGFIYTLPNGRLNIQGSREKPVLIQTDRLEETFSEQPGQYLGIIIGPESRGNRIENAEILHGIQGIIVDSLAELSLSNVTIAYTLGSAVSARNATVRAENSLFHSNNGNTVVFIQGGTLTLDHCTLANYGTDASALALQNFECFDDNCDNFALVPMRLTVNNSVISGSRADEIIFVDGTNRDDPNFFRASITNSVVRVDELLTAQEGLWDDFFENACINCYNLAFQDPLFLDLDEDDYHLDTLSVAQDLGMGTLPGLELDLDGVMRDATPDAGCYERVE